ncbi:MAG: hypothetical protein NC092_05045 [Butyrivibrio sp.]|nr:hypothetical protein [Muribaculum sp.]MCM1552040.1 hypothetical protein [Butyrivibrio sp.]
MKKGIVLLIICMVILIFWVQKGNSNVDEGQSFWGYSAFAKCGQRYFYIKNDYATQRTNIMYLDKDMNPTYLCSENECLHNTHDCCSYEVYGGLLPESIWSYDDKIYVCAPKQFGDMSRGK